MNIPMDKHPDGVQKTQRSLFDRIRERYPDWKQAPRDSPIIPEHPPLPNKPKYTYMPYEKPAVDSPQPKIKGSRKLTDEELKLFFK